MNLGHLLTIIAQCAFILAPPAPSSPWNQQIVPPAYSWNQQTVEDLMSSISNSMDTPSSGPINTVKLSNNDEALQVEEVKIPNKSEDDEGVQESLKEENKDEKKPSNPFDFTDILNDDKNIRFLQGFGLDVEGLRELSKLHDVDDIQKALDDGDFIWKVNGFVYDFLRQYVDSYQKIKKAPKKFDDVQGNEDYVQMLQEHGITEDILANMSKITKEEKFSDVLNNDEYAAFLQSRGVNVEMLRNTFQVWGNFDLSTMKNKFSKVAQIQKYEVLKNLGFDDPDDFVKADDKSKAFEKVIYKYPTKFGIKLPEDQCKSDDNEEGDCMTGAECVQAGGQASGSCHKGYDYSPFPRVCCVHKQSCETKTKRSVSYFTSENLDKGSCSMEIYLAPTTCQVRLDFIQLMMGRMVGGQCPPTDSLQIRTNIKNSFIPVSSMCGNINSDKNNLKPPHLYLHVGMDDPNTQRIIYLNTDITSARNMWNIKVSQIQCDGAQLQAPSGCAQYYNTEVGTIASLNYLDGTYSTNTDLTVCIKPQPACAIQYNMSPFMLDDKMAATGNINYGLMCSDYIAFAGEKIGLCGYSGGTQVTLPADGVQGFTFRSNEESGRNEVGFVIQYRFLRKCNYPDFKFFTYPETKYKKK